MFGLGIAVAILSKFYHFPFTGIVRQLSFTRFIQFSTMPLRRDIITDEKKTCMFLPTINPHTDVLKSNGHILH